ncbi:hypothetical protein KAF80_28975 [Bacillus sp. WL1]|nr:hypothetical protein [Bacillus sp. WL1]
MLEETSYIKETDEWNFNNISDSGQYVKLLEEAKIFMDKKGFSYISKELLNTTLEGIETEYTKELKVVNKGRKHGKVA